MVSRRKLWILRTRDRRKRWDGQTSWDAILSRVYKCSAYVHYKVQYDPIEERSVKILNVQSRSVSRPKLTATHKIECNFMLVKRMRIAHSIYQRSKLGLIYVLSERSAWLIYNYSWACSHTSYLPIQQALQHFWIPQVSSQLRSSIWSHSSWYRSL